MSLKRGLLPVFAVIYVFLLADGIAACLYKAAVVPWQAGGTNKLTAWELPLAGINGLACDAAGRVYVGTEGYHRVQVYSHDGRFQYGVDVGSATAHGGFTFRVAESGQLEIYGVRTKAITSFDRNGLVSSHNAEFLPDWKNVTAVTRGEGRLILGKWSWLWPTVIEMDADGQTRTIVRQPVWIWLLRLPTPAMWFLLVGFFGTCWLARRKKGAQVE